MSKTVLVIDDSTTIRRLCDSELSSAGFHVLLAPNAEDGVTMAKENTPNLIILDHQLPGTTGYEVCQLLLQDPDTARIPVIASSTLRKKAYAEYIECDNVVDMLPKPYTPEALIATVENGIDTAGMVVQSQYNGSAVPETINSMGEPDLSGTFGCLGLREVIDMLTNGSKQGVLEIECDRGRVLVHLAAGRIQSVTANGIDPSEVENRLPEGLTELKPIIKMTVAARRGSEVGGLVELLNNKMLDPRLLKKLLRIQAAVLLRMAFTSQLTSFRFHQLQSLPSLCEKLPLQSSLLSLLVEASLLWDVHELPANDGQAFVRKSIRGQNLDRAGLSSRHMKLMSMVAQPTTAAQAAHQLDWPEEEVFRVMCGFEMAELVESCPASNATQVVGLTGNSELGEKFKTLFARDEINGQIVRDGTALRLLVRRQIPEVIMLDLNDCETTEQLKSVLAECREMLSEVRLVGIRPHMEFEMHDDGSLPLSQFLNADSNVDDWMDAVCGAVAT